MLSVAIALEAWPQKGRRRLGLSLCFHALATSKRQKCAYCEGAARALGFMDNGGEETLFRTKLFLNPQAEPGERGKSFQPPCKLSHRLFSLSADATAETAIRRLEKTRQQAELGLIARACREMDELTTERFQLRTCP